MGSRPISRAPGTAAATAGCESCGTAALTTTTGSTATRPCGATATAAATSFASPTTRPTCRVDRGATAMSPLEVSLAAAALVIGMTGAWSPCGFSMVETLGLAGERGRRLTVGAACAAFVPGAVIGGVATFGLLSGVGELVHGAGRVAYLIAAAIAVAAAAAEVRGLRIAPQIRRQLPERWRWTMPLPVAGLLYGVLLGLGFTTFVLSFGVWALAGISLVLGDPTAGLVIGAAFGVGRAIPVLLVAPWVDTRRGNRCIELMAERPVLYRAFRFGDALILGLVAVALT